MESCEIGSSSKPSVMDPTNVACNSPDPDPFELPPEVWTEVFKPLSTRQLLRCRLVCRRWKDIVDGCPGLRRKISVRFSKKLPKNPTHLPPASAVRFVAMLLTTVDFWWPLLGQGLTELVLDYCTIELGVLLGMLKETPNLKKFELVYVELGGELIAPSDMRLAKVEHLKLCEIMPGRILGVFRKLCCNLKALHITWDLSNGYIVSSQEVANIMVDSQNTLQELDITGSDEILMEMLKLDRMKLKKLTLKVRDNVNEKQLNALCRTQQSLEYLDIHSIPSLYALWNLKRFNDLYKLLPNIKSVVLHLGQEAAQVDLTNLPSMAKLRILSLRGDVCHGCERAPLVIRFSESGYCNVTELQLANIDLSEEHSKDTFKQLLAQMPNLRILDMMETSIDTWPSLFKMLGSLNHLEKLSLDVYPNDKSRCKKVEDLIGLQHLCIWDCKTSSKLLASILSRCPNLRELVLLLEKNAINKDVLWIICQKLTRLSDLTVSNETLSKDDETYLRANCLSLKELQILGSKEL